MATPERVVRYEFHRDFSADLEARRVLKLGQPLPNALTLKEFEVLEFFLKNPRKVIPRESVEPLWMPPSGRIPTDNYLSKIASKLGIDRDELFETIRGVGYSLEVNVRPVFESDQQEGGDFFKASKLHFNTHTVDSMRVSLKQSLRALAINPRGIPEAHVTAAYDYINLSITAYSAEPPREVIPKARQHAEDAFREDPKSSRALGVLGLISLIYNFDWDKAKQQLEDALKLDLNDSATLLSYAHYLVGTGRLSEAVDTVERAAKIDPTDLIIHASVGWIHLFAGDIHGAIQRGEKTTFLYPDFPPGYVILGWAYEAAGRYPEARKHYQISLEKEYSPAALASLGHLEAILGDRSKGEAALRELDQLYRRGGISYVPAYCRALIFAGLGEIDSCIGALEEAYQQHCDWLIHLAVESRWDRVRSCEGFNKIVQKVGVTTPPRRKVF
jgi:tetratricopeptide (TPR) repeat protein